MILNTADSLIREFFDISDKRTRKTIVSLDEDANEKSQMLSALSNALYDKIVSNVDKIEFGSIPRSRGDITKVDGFDNTIECLNILRRLVMEYHENPEIVDTVITAIENIKSRKTIFMKSYSLNIEFPIVLYNLIVLAIEQSVSFLISVCIQYIKDSESGSMNAALDKIAYNNTRDNLLYEQLYNFNESCSNGELDAALADIIKGHTKVSEAVEEELKEGLVASISVGVNDDGTARVDVYQSPFTGEYPPDDDPDGIVDDLEMEIQNDIDDIFEFPFDDEVEIARDYPVEEPNILSRIPINGSAKCENKTVQEFAPAVAAAIPTVIKAAGIAVFTLKTLQFLLKCLVPLLRSITYFFIYSRVKFADLLSIQSQFIESNAYKLQYSSNLDDSKRVKVVNRQLKIANTLKKFANRISIDHNKAQRSAMQQMVSDDRKMTVSDIESELPLDIAQKSVLF